MTAREAEAPSDRLLLRNELSEIAQLPAWIGGLASRHAIPQNVEYAINLCLEEAVANVILYGYGDGAAGRVAVIFSAPKPDLFVFVVEDDARHFNPLDAPAPKSDGTLRVGGQGVHFMRNFTSELRYEKLPGGNRLRMVFDAMRGDS